MEDLRLSLIRQTEQAIDVLRKEQERLQALLAEIDPQLEEARELLQMLKTGKVPSGSKPKRTTTSRADYEEALKFFEGEEFTASDYAEALEVSNNAAAVQLKRFAQEGVVEMVKGSEMTSQGRTRTIWRVK